LGFVDWTQDYSVQSSTQLAITVNSELSYNVTVTVVSRAGQDKTGHGMACADSDTVIGSIH